MRQFATAWIVAAAIFLMMAAVVVLPCECEPTGKDTLRGVLSPQNPGNGYNERAGSCTRSECSGEAAALGDADPKSEGDAADAVDVAAAAVAAALLAKSSAAPPAAAAVDPVDPPERVVPKLAVPKSSGGGGWIRRGDFHPLGRLTTEFEGGPCDITKVGSLSVADFDALYLNQKPVIVSDGAADWAALEKWTPAYLNDAFGDTPISAGGSQAVVQTGSGEVNLTFEKFLNVSSKIRKMKSKHHPLWKDGDEGVGADAGDRDDALAADSGERREPGPHFYLEQLYLFDRTILAQTPTLHSDTHTPNFLASIPFGGGEQFFAVGDVGTGTVWHQHDSAWNAVVVGEKRWFLWPPNNGPPRGEYPARRSIHHWFDLVYKGQLAADPKQTPLECTLGPGEVIYLPPGWYHSTINVLETVAISGQIMAEGLRGVNVNTFENQLDLAKAGNPKAQFNIGNLYLEGSGGAKQSIKKAVKWFKKSAAAGLPQAQANLADMYLNGEGVKQDEVEARRLLKLAAKQGLPEAQFELGKLLAFQSYTKEDVEAGIGWLQKAADQGIGPAAEALNAAQDAMTQQEQQMGAGTKKQNSKQQKQKKKKKKQKKQKKKQKKKKPGAP